MKRSFNIRFYLMILFISTITVFLVPNPVLPLMAAVCSLWELLAKLEDKVSHK